MTTITDTYHNIFSPAERRRMDAAWLIQLRFGACALDVGGSVEGHAGRAVTKHAVTSRYQARPANDNEGSGDG